MTRVLATIIACGAVLTACSPSPQPIHYGEDACAYCMMTISDVRYGAEIVSRTGKAYKFDSVECMAAYELENREGVDRIHTRYVTDFMQPGDLISLDDALILHSENLRSPMGMNLTAFGRALSPTAAVDSVAGRVVGWQDVQRMVGEGWNTSAPAVHDEAE